MVTENHILIRENTLEFLICGNPAVLEKLDLSHMNP